MSGHARLTRAITRKVYRRDYGDVAIATHRGVVDVTVHMSVDARELLVIRRVREARRLAYYNERGRTLLGHLGLASGSTP